MAVSSTSSIMKYLLIDTANMFFRARHVVSKSVDAYTKLSLAVHITLNSVAKVWRDFDADHVIFCLEGRSWRKDFYIPYKANRKVLRDQRKPREIEDDELYFEAYNDMIQYNIV